jgi:hypothetical protein
MAITVFVGPYVHGPNPTQATVDTVGGSAWKRWFKALRQSLARLAPNHSPFGDRDRPAEPRSPAAVTRWAYRVTNYHRLRAAGLTCLIAPPNAAAGISSHLDLEAIESVGLRTSDVVLVETGQTVPVDGTILEGMARVDESAINGQSAPVFRSVEGEAAVMCNSRIVEGQILVQVAPRRGHPLDWIDGSTPQAGRLQAEVVR